MVKVRIRIEAWSPVDPWARYHGKSIDEPIAPDFWVSQRDKIIGINWARNPRFSHEQEVDLPPGEHYVEYSNSSISSLPWNARIYINGKKVAEGVVYRGKPLRATFTVGAPPTPTPPPAIPTIPTWVWPVIGVVAIGSIIGVAYALKARARAR